MSLHPQHAGYGHFQHQHQQHYRNAPAHPPLPQQGPPPAGYGYPSRQPQPMDAHSFRQFYSQQLAQLTFNSRPVIQNLSILAQDYSRMAHVVAQCLETHTRLVSPQYKLTALYLLDAIAKNVYNPYASVFAENVTRIFIDAYESVDPNTRGKMEEMMMTWRNGSQTRRELFGVAVQRNIENFVASKHSSTARAPPPVQQRPNQNRITKGQVLTELDVTIAQKQISLQSNHDDATASQVETLKQLHSVVRGSDLSQAELGAILAQLRSMVKVPTPTRTPVVDPRANQFSSSMNGHLQPPKPLSPQQNSNKTTPISADLRAFLNTVVTTQSNPQPIVPQVQTNTDLSSAISSLMQSVPSLSQEALQRLKQLGGTQSGPIESNALREYENAVLGGRLKPTSSEIARQNSQMTAFLYEHRSHQCRQCGLRIPHEDGGQQKMDDHLDMHFAQNSRNDQLAGRGHSRSWFVGFENWLPEYKSKAQNEKERATVAAQERETRLKDAFVVIPLGEESKTVTCPICKEVLNPEFMEDEEEWVYKNAIEVNEKIFHSTCHADAASATPNALISRIKQQMEYRSRSVTPDRLGSKSPQPNLKRKLRDDDEYEAMDLLNQIQVKVENIERTPPLKKAAISSEA